MRVPTPLRRVLRFWEWPFLAVLAYLMFHWRMQSFDLNVKADQVYYMGTDPYYHLRATLVSVRDFPNALRWDPWTFFPNGTYTGQFGTLFDRALAAVVILLEGSDATLYEIQRIGAVYPAVLGALCVVPVYFVGRRILGPLGGAYAAVLLALNSGSFFSRSVAGYFDHHVAETLMSTLAVLGVLVAVERARAAEALFAAPRANARALAKVLAWSALAALAVAAYLWTWPPGVLFVAIMAASLSLVIGFDHAKGLTSRGTAVAAGVAFVGATLLVLPLRDTGGFEVTFYTWTQPLTLLLAAGFLALLAWGSERFHAPLKGYRFLAAVVASGFVVLAVMFFAAPSYFSVVAGGFEWVTGIGYAGGGRTIAEARPTSLDDMYSEYGMLFYGAMIGLVLVLVDVARRPNPSNTTLLVWSAFMTVAAFAQIRFNYYFAVNVALLNGYLVAFAARSARLDEAWKNMLDAPEAPRGRRAARHETLSWKQPAAVALATLFVLPGNVFIYDGALDCGRAEFRPAWALAKCLGPDREVQFWTDGLAWLRTETPDPGFDLGATPDKETFRYPDHAYGVISWWDYGHWEEVLGERPPVANPFQQAAPFAARYFTAQSEAEAEQLLTDWSPRWPVRYVLIDDASASTKFYAITVWAKKDAEYGVYTRVTAPDGRPLQILEYGPMYEASLMSRLYRDDASGMEHYRLVHEERAMSLVGNIVNVREGRVSAFNDILDAGSAPAMASQYGLNYRSNGLLCVSGSSPDGSCPSEEYAYDLEVNSALKIFERVKGARVSGTAAPGSTVTALLDLKAGETQREFSVRHTTVADEDGTWRFTLAYPTTGFLGVANGGTDADVVAKGPWAIVVGDLDDPVAIHEADVGERAVIEGLTVPVS